MKRLEGKNVLVTGASSGIGRAVALACAKEGANVAVCARRADRLEEVAAEIRGLGVKAAICVADVAVEDEILAALAAAQTQLGSIDVLVNNAGTNLKNRTISETTVEEWQRILDINLTSAYIFTKAILPTMFERQDGVIINIASRAAMLPSVFAGVSYSASKIGMEALTKVTNEEANAHGVRACVIHPGEVETEILVHRRAAPTPEHRARMMQGEDIAEAVVFVAALPARANVDYISIKPTKS
ncbi:SDR family NAD(P)-dependent oxidoreductase [bacterium]|nr:SDR family NAD(P)-dependent oxidoreductase [bacterium]